MNYFQAYTASLDDTIVAAWDSQVAELIHTPGFGDLVAAEDAKLLPRFADYYARLRAMPRGARRSLERKLARRCRRAVLPAWQMRLATSVAGAALLLALQGVGQAATINVTPKAPQGIDGDGKCSLAEAIVNANNGGATFGDCEAGSGDDTIVLPKGTVTLTAVDNDDFGDTGLPVITSKITIQGNGAKIVRSKSAPPFRLFAVSQTGDLTLENVTLSGARTVGKERGGAITNYGSVTISSSTISGNVAFEGGAVFNGHGILNISDTSITNNVANYGGGLTDYSGGTLTMTNSTLSKNRALPYNGNPSFGGGLLSTASHDTITGSVITGNSATKGGGISVYGVTLISDTTITKNTATDRGGGVYNGDFHSLTITGSTISGNRADTGGGVSNRGSFDLASGMITKNSATTYGGGVDTSGTGVFTDGGTVTGNKAPTGADVYGQ